MKANHSWSFLQYLQWLWGLLMFEKQVLHDIDNAHQLVTKSTVTTQRQNQILDQEAQDLVKVNSPQRSIYHQTLHEPLNDFLSRPRKDFRGQLVQIGFSLIAVGEATEIQIFNLQLLTQVVEALHSGSLIIDDIQDESQERRGKACLHRIYGTPLALNAGNWLYFWAYSQLNKLRIDTSTKDQIFQLMTETMLQAHFGQSLDIGIRISELPQSEVAEICLRNIEQKSGALMAMAICFGAIIAGAKPQEYHALSLFGHELGTSLQMFDDIGNLNLKRGQVKHLEDLMLRRPSWVWAFISTRLNSDDYREFKQAVEELPNLSRLQSWIEKHDFHRQSSIYATEFMQQSLAQIKKNIIFQTEKQKNALQQLHHLSERIQNAYK